eukprot:5872815-Amphidinium_carterae.3
MKVMTTSQESHDNSEGSCTLHSQDTAKEADSSTTTESTFSLSQGGARTRRVQQEAITTTAIERLTADLGSTSYGLLIEHKCAARILRTDHRAATAIFQAHSASQRYDAFAAALHRAGLTDLAKGMTRAAEMVTTKPGTVDNTSTGSEQSVPAHMAGPDASSDPYMVPAGRKRGRPKREMESATAAPAAPLTDTEKTAQHDSLSLKLQELTMKMSQLERWAHGVDKTLSECKPTGGAPSLTPTDSQVATEPADSDIPPTVEYAPGDETGQVAHRVAQLERSIQQQNHGTPSYEVMTRIARAEAAIKLVATKVGSLEGTAGQSAGANLSNRVDQLETNAGLAAAQLSRLHIDHIGTRVTPAEGPEQDAELHLDWRLHMIERTIHEHVNAAQELNERWSNEWKIAQARAQRMQAEVEELRHSNYKQDQLLNVIWPWLTALATKIQRCTQPAFPVTYPTLAPFSEPLPAPVWPPMCQPLPTASS